MTSLMLLAVELALAGAPRPVHGVHPVHAANVRAAPVFAHAARPVPPPGGATGSAHPAAPVASSNRPPAQGSRAQPGTCRNPGHHHPDHHGDRQPGGWAGPWAQPPGPYVYGSGSDYGYGDDLEVADPGPSESWDTPVDATDGWSEAAPPPDDAAAPQDNGAAQPQDNGQPQDDAAPPPSAPAAANDGCTETEDTDVDDSQAPAIYQWVDAQGALHFSDYDLIPPAARASAVRTSGDPIVVTHKHLRCGPGPSEPPPAQAP